MTDTEIVKALEYCGCAECMAILDIINRQKAEIERLEDYNENLLAANVDLSCGFLDEIQGARAEAIKEFADRLLALKIKPEFPWDDFFVTETAINDTLKEMTEETP